VRQQYYIYLVALTFELLTSNRPSSKAARDIGNYHAVKL